MSHQLSYLCPEFVRNNCVPCLADCHASKAPGVLTRPSVALPVPPTLALLARTLCGGMLSLTKLLRVKLPLRRWFHVLGPDGATPDMFDTMLTERAAREGKSNTAGSSPESAEKVSAGLKLTRPMSAPRAACMAGLIAIGMDLACCRLLAKAALARGLPGKLDCEDGDLAPNSKLSLLPPVEGSRLYGNDSRLRPACADGSVCSGCSMLLRSGDCGPAGTWPAPGEAGSGVPLPRCWPCCISDEKLPVCAACCWQAALTCCQRARGLAACSGNKLPVASCTAQRETASRNHKPHQTRQRHTVDLV